MTKSKILLIILLVALFVFNSNAQETINDSTTKTSTSKQLKVGYTGSYPFITSGSNPDGIIIDLWKEISYGTDYEYDFIHFDDVNIGINAVQKNELDILIGPITINLDRAKKISFSQPFYNTELAILSPIRELTMWDRLSPFFSINFIYAVFGLIFILTLVGFLVWLVERKGELEEYRDKPLQGIGIGVWLAIVTMTTVGYGDYSPKTPAGRAILGSWMVISLIMATSFVAGIASTLTASSNTSNTITTLSQIDTDKRVAIPSISRLSDNIRANGGKPIVVHDVDEAMELLNEGKVEAIVYDVIPLEHIYNKLDKDEFIMTTNGLYKQNYGFVLPTESNLKREVNLKILELKESNEIQQIIDLWVNKE